MQSKALLRAGPGLIEIALEVGHEGHDQKGACSRIVIVVVFRDGYCLANQWIGQLALAMQQADERQVRKRLCRHVTFVGHPCDAHAFLKIRSRAIEVAEPL